MWIKLLSFLLKQKLNKTGKVKILLKKFFSEQ